MGRYCTTSLETNSYQELIEVIREGYTDYDGVKHRPNNQLATILILEANLGCRIGDILNLTTDSIIEDGGIYKLNITEQKTGKKRTFTVPFEVMEYLRRYCIDNNISDDERIFPITERYVEKFLKYATDFLEYTDISTHSFRKFFATEIYINNDYNVVLVQTLLQHSSPAITQKYIGISSKDVENALNNHVRL